MKYEIEYKHTIKDFEDVYNIEQQYLEPSTISSVEQVVSWENKNPDIDIFIRDLETDEIIGEITLLPLSKQQFNAFMNNTLEDTEINVETLLRYEPNNSYYLLYSAMAIHPDYRNDRLVFGLLLKGFYDKINMLKDNNITFLNMCSEGQTSDGQKFIESFLNLKPKNITKNGYKLYSFDNTKDFDNWFNVFPQYIENYKQKIKNQRHGKKLYSQRCKIKNKISNHEIYFKNKMCS